MLKGGRSRAAIAATRCATRTASSWGWRRCRALWHTLVHNGCSFELWRMMREAGVYCEVEPRHLFNTLLPAAYLLQLTSYSSSRGRDRISCPMRAWTWRCRRRR